MRDQVLHGLLSTRPTDGGAFAAVFRFDPDLPVFRGHFPGSPLVPGVFLMEAARLAAERAAGRRLRISAIDDARFVAPVHPGDTIDVVGTLTPDAPAGRKAWACRASLSRAGGGDLAAKVRLRLLAEGEPPGGCETAAGQ